MYQFFCVHEVLSNLSLVVQLRICHVYVSLHLGNMFRSDLDVLLRLRKKLAESLLDV